MYKLKSIQVELSHYTKQYFTFHGVLLNAGHIEKHFRLKSQILIFVFHTMNNFLYDNQFLRKSIILQPTAMYSSSFISRKLDVNSMDWLRIGYMREWEVETLLKGGDKRSMREIILKTYFMELFVMLWTRLDSLALLTNVINLRIPNRQEISWTLEYLWTVLGTTCFRELIN